MNLHLKNGNFSVPTIEPIDNYNELLDDVDLEFPLFDPNLKKVRSISGLIEKIKKAGEKEEFGEGTNAISYAYGFSTDGVDDLCFVIRLTRLKELTLEDITKSQIANHISYESHIFELKDAQYLFELIWED